MAFLEKFLWKGFEEFRNLVHWLALYVYFLGGWFVSMKNALFYYCIYLILSLGGKKFELAVVIIVPYKTINATHLKSNEIVDKCWNKS